MSYTYKNCHNTYNQRRLKPLQLTSSFDNSSSSSSNSSYSEPTESSSISSQSLRKPLSSTSILSSPSKPILCPLDAFPSKSDTISSAFFSIVDSKKRQRKKEDSIRWLYVDKIDSDFGVQGDSHEDHIRKAYRRIESSALFNPTSQRDSSLTDLIPTTNPNKKYIVIEESRLQELTRLEDMLRREKAMLGNQCGLAVSEFQMKANVPVPATRIAINTLCEQQLQRISRDYTLLAEKWSRYCKENHYNKNHLFIEGSYVKTAPVSQRAMKLRLVRDAVHIWRVRKDRDTMLYEDDLSYLMGKYYEAKIRQLDYDRYYIIASRYGSYSEEEFNRDPRPGKRYYVQVTTGALKLQLLWDRFWAMTKLRRYRACRIIQKYYRRRFYYRRYHPIIAIRLKIGKKTYFMYCFNSWKTYNTMCRRIKAAIQKRERDCLNNNWQAFKNYLQGERKMKFEKAKTLLSRTLNTGTYSKFHRWLVFVNKQKALKRKLRRLFGFPHFDLWCEYVALSKKEKYKHVAVTKLASWFRAINHRKIFMKKIRAQRRILHFSRLVLSIRRVRLIREQVVYKEFLQWEPEEQGRRASRANEIERQRLLKRQRFVQEQEKKQLSKVKQHIQSPDGRIQLKEMMKSGYNWTYASSIMTKMGLYKDVKTLSSSDKLAYCQKVLLTQCSNMVRQLEAHNYDSKHPPFILCPDIKCHATFTTESQYHNHIRDTPCHQPQQQQQQQQQDDHHDGSPQFTSFHLLLRHPKGLECLRHFLTTMYGISGVVNYLDAWISIQEWRKLSTASENYELKAINILELFLLKDSPRRLNLSFPNYSSLLDHLACVKNKDYSGYYRNKRTTTGLIGSLVGSSGSEYYEYTTEEILRPDAFDEVEWTCFMHLFRVVEDRGGGGGRREGGGGGGDVINDELDFYSSDAFLKYKHMVDIEAGQRRAESLRLYEQTRKMRLEVWTRQFMEVERAMSRKAFEAVHLFLDREVDRHYHLVVEKEQVHLRTEEKRHAEQSRYEFECAIVDDMVFFAETNILDSIFDFYVVSLLDAMLKVSDMRKGLLQYAGFVKATSRHMKTEDLLGADKKKGGDEWFNKFFSSTKSKEEEDNEEQDTRGNQAKRTTTSSSSSSLDVVAVAAIRIQKRIRGYLGRKKARKVFIKAYVKLIDPASKRVYYFNNNSRTSSWNRPLITRHLLPHIKW